MNKENLRHFLKNKLKNEYKEMMAYKTTHHFRIIR